MMKRATVKQIDYSPIFRAAVLAEYPASSGIADALVNNSYMLGRWLDDGRSFGMTPEGIIAAFRDGHQQDVLRAAEKSVRRTALYAAWDLEVFTEDQGGSQR